VLWFGEVAGGGVVHHGVGAVAFAGIAVAVGAVFIEDRFGGAEICVGSGERILAKFVFERDFPGSFVESGEADGEEDKGNDEGEKEFEKRFLFFGRSGHVLFTVKIFA
jgi:hypothetical protein